MAYFGATIQVSHSTDQFTYYSSTFRGSIAWSSTRVWLVNFVVVSWSFDSRGNLRQRQFCQDICISICIAIERILAISVELGNFSYSSGAAGKSLNFRVQSPSMHWNGSIAMQQSPRFSLYIASNASKGTPVDLSYRPPLSLSSAPSRSKFKFCSEQRHRYMSHISRPLLSDTYHIHLEQFSTVEQTSRLQTTRSTSIWYDFVYGERMQAIPVPVWHLLLTALFD